MNTFLSGRYAVCVVAAVIVCSIGVVLRLSVPEGFAVYVHNGLMLPVFRYGLLFVLIACGVVLSGERRSIALAAHLVVLASALWFGLQRTEALVLSSVTLTEIIVSYPVVTTAMGMITGITLLVPIRARKWLVPFMCICCGLGVGLFIILESPLDYYYGWFSSAGGLGGMAVIIASIALADGARWICTSSSFAIAERIFGSWLIAASLLLAALAIVPQQSIEPESTPFDIFDDIKPLTGVGNNAPQ